MSDNLPVIRETSREIATTDTDSWIEVMGSVVKLSAHIADTEFVPKGLRGSAPATAAAMLYGREVGLPPMTALNMTHVVEGKPGISAEGMRALVFAAGHQIEFVQTTGAVCQMRARRHGSDGWTDLVWTIDMARAAGLLGKNNWKGYPRAMLQARCTTELCRMIFPDVIHGFRSVEELEDMGAEDGDTQPTAAAQLEGPTTTVKRTRKTTVAKKVAQTPAALPAPRAGRVAGPPLPGEDGYDELTGSSTPPVEGGEQVEGSQDAPGSEVPAESVEGGAEGDPSTDPPVDDETPTSPADEPSEKAPSPRKASAGQRRMTMGAFSRFVRKDDREERLLITSKIVGRAVQSSNDLTAQEASKVIDTLSRLPDRQALNDLLDAIDDAESGDGS